MGSGLLRRLRRLTSLGLRWSRDLLLETYTRAHTCAVPVLVKPLMVETARLLPDEVVRLYQQNCFDLLGSGWRDWSAGQGMNRVNRANRAYGRYLRTLISPGYRPIDWHTDIRAGYRWPANRWSRWIVPGRPAGVDIKLPWEMSRMQHQVPLALSVLGQPEMRRVEACRFRDQVLDFMAANPPRFGVNWRTPMDVAIRAANWVLAYSLYRAAEEVFDAEFERVLAAALLDHGRHIVREMEWDPHWRGNHYLANQCGLAILAAALPASPETDAWLAFACQELNLEVLRQVQPDGSVFEASTGYHRLSVEMVVYAAAVVLGTLGLGGLERLARYDAGAVRFKKALQPAPLRTHALPGAADRVTPFSPSFFHRLAAAAAFVRDITMPDGRIPLIGDNDSGRFVRVRFLGELLDWGEARARHANLAGVHDAGDVAQCPLEDQRDIRYLMACIGAIVDDPFLQRQADVWQVEAAFVRSLSGGLTAFVPLPAPVEESNVSASGPGPVPERALKLRIGLPPGACDDLERRAYPDFGLYLFRGPRLYLAVRCGPIGQDGFGGHAHNDQLSVILQVDGRDLIADPGVYRYTVDSEERRVYRSVQAHFAPRADAREPGDLSLGPWRLGDEAKAALEYFGGHTFQGSHLGFGERVHRRVWLEDDSVWIADWCDGALQLVDPGQIYSRLDGDGCLVPFCPGYGVQHA